MMQTYLIVSSNNIFIEDKINEFKKKLTITPYTYHEILSLTSIGIDQVRQLKQIFTLTPYEGKERLVVIKDIDKATIAAQNALLKILEEPPKDTYIVACAQNSQALLPTVVSRCQIIKDTNSSVSEEDTEKGKKLIKQIIGNSVGERILLSQQFTKTKEDTLTTLDLLITTLHELISHHDENIRLSLSNLVSLLKKTMQAKNYVERNINYKATLDILLMGFPKI
jgi:DNA polymerase III delta prime subunit